MSPAGDQRAVAGTLADGTGAVLITLIYGLAGPPIGAILLSPLAGLVRGDAWPAAMFGGLFLLAATFPFSLLLAYHSAGLLALGTGIVIAVIARRRGAVSLWTASGAAVAVFLPLHALAGMTDLSVPGAAVLRGGSLGSALVFLATSVVASVACCLLTRPIQRRVRSAGPSTAG